MVEPQVLVVDDDPNVRETIRDLLELEEIPVLVLGPTADVPGLLRQHPIRVVVTDLNMPERDGLEVIQLVTATSRELNREIPVYILTGAGGEARLEQALREGATRWFPKPFDLDQFTQALREVLEDDSDA